MNTIKWFGFLIVLVVAAGSVQATPIGMDAADNYSTATWTNTSNEGSGFGAWDLFSDATAGFFVFDSTEHGHGDINTTDVAFGLFGNDNGYANAQRAITDWDDEYTFRIDMTFRFRDGARGLSLFDDNGFAPGDEIWNFNVDNAGYGFTDWAFQGDMVIEFAITQDGSDLLIDVAGSSASGAWSATTNTTLSAVGTLGGFRAYSGSPEDDGNNNQRNTYFNNLEVIPEPGAMAMFIIGLAGLLGVRRFRK
jgi:hypothetical protein